MEAEVIEIDEKDDPDDDQVIEFYLQQNLTDPQELAQQLKPPTRRKLMGRKLIHSQRIRARSSSVICVTLKPKLRQGSISI